MNAVKLLLFIEANELFVQYRGVKQDCEAAHARYHELSQAKRQIEDRYEGLTYLGNKYGLTVLSLGYRLEVERKQKEDAQKNGQDGTAPMAPPAVLEDDEIPL